MRRRAGREAEEGRKVSAALILPQSQICTLPNYEPASAQPCGSTFDPDHSLDPGLFCQIVVNTLTHQAAQTTPAGARVMGVGENGVLFA